MQLPTPYYRIRRRLRNRWHTFWQRAAFLYGHATRPFTGPAPNWTVYTIFVLILLLMGSVLANILFLGIFLIARYG